MRSALASTWKHRLVAVAFLGSLLSLGCDPKKIRPIGEGVALGPGGTAWLKVDASGIPEGELDWRVANLGGGTVDPQGRYTAPDRPGVYQVMVCWRRRPGVRTRLDIQVGYPVAGRALPPLLRPRVNPGLALLKDGTVLVVGGDGANPRIAERYDPGKGVSIPVGEVPHPGAYGPMPLPDGRVLLLAPSGPCLMFDPEGNQLRPVGALNQARSGFNAIVLADGRVLVVGGELLYPFGIGGPPRAVLSVECFDPSTGQFRELGALQQPRIGSSLSRLPDGRILVLGGRMERMDTSVAGGEIFDPASGQSVTLERGLTTPRHGHQSLTLPDGHILVIGGWRGSLGPATTLEILDPASGATVLQMQGGEDCRGFLQEDGSVLLVKEGAQWVLHPEAGRLEALPLKLERRRSGFSSILLADRRLLLVGGGDVRDQVDQVDLLSPR